MGDIQLNFFDHLIMFVVCIVLPSMAIMGSRHAFDSIDITPELKKMIYRNNSLFLWTATLLVLIVWISSGRTLPALGIKKIVPDASPYWTYFILAFLVFYIADIIRGVVTEEARKNTIKKWKKHTPFMPSNWNEFFWFIGVALTAGICEEVIFRGYMINYMLTAFKSYSIAVPLSVTLPAVIFGVSHAYQGEKAVLKVVVMAILFGFVFILTGSILLLIALHTLVDLVSSLAGLWLINTYPDQFYDDDVGMRS